MQLFSIHSFVRSGASIKQVPLVFVMMSGRRAVDYSAVFRALLDLLPAEIALLRCVADYEAAIWQSLRGVFPPRISIQGCLFHFTQSIWRKVQELGLQRIYVDDEGTNEICRRLMSLPLLPHPHIREMFNMLIEGIGPDCVALLQLADYMRTQWIDGAIFSPVDWVVFNQHVRTNNDVEGWHYRLNHRAKKGQLPFYLLCSLLHKEAKLITMQMTLVLRQDLSRHQRHGAVVVNEKLVDLWTAYSESRLSIQDLLVQGSHLICPRRDGDGNEVEAVVA